MRLARFLVNVGAPRLEGSSHLRLEYYVVDGPVVDYVMDFTWLAHLGLNVLTLYILRRL